MMDVLLPQIITRSLTRWRIVRLADYLVSARPIGGDLGGRKAVLYIGIYSFTIPIRNNAMQIDLDLTDHVVNIELELTGEPIGLIFTYTMSDIY